MKCPDCGEEMKRLLNDTLELWECPDCGTGLGKWREEIREVRPQV